MLPVDVVAFLEHADPKGSKALNFLLSILWEPEPIRIIASSTKSSLRVRFIDMLETIQKHRDDNDAVWKRMRLHHQILNEDGCCRHFGVIAIGKKLNVIRDARQKDVSKHQVRLGIGKEEKLFTIIRKATTSIDNCQELQTTLVGSWSLTNDTANLTDLAEQITVDLEQLGAWARTGSDARKSVYVLPHARRKQIMLAMGLGSETASCNSPVVTMQDLSYCPDVKQHLKLALESMRLSQITKASLPLHPILLSAWACLLETCMNRDEKLRSFFLRVGSPVLFEKARVEVTRRLGCTPTVSMVALHAVSLAQ
jgi:hypothetical protein